MERKDRKSDFKIDIFVCAKQAEELIIVFENKYYKYMKKLCLFTSVLMVMFNLSAQQQVTTFEMRHFKSDAKANGVTDFHGETEVFDTDQRISALYKYADYASKFWGDPNLDKPLFTDDEVRERVAKIKAQPTTSVRRTLSLDNWRAYGYKAGKEQVKLCLDSCVDALQRIRDMAKENSELDNEHLSQLCNDGTYPKVSARIVGILRNLDKENN